MDPKVLCVVVVIFANALRLKKVNKTGESQ